MSWLRGNSRSKMVTWLGERDKMAMISNQENGSRNKFESELVKELKVQFKSTAATITYRPITLKHRRTDKKFFPLENKRYAAWIDSQSLNLETIWNDLTRPSSRFNKAIKQMVAQFVKLFAFDRWNLPCLQFTKSI